jgi:hypothetical protein
MKRWNWSLIGKRIVTGLVVLAVLMLLGDINSNLNRIARKLDYIDNRAAATHDLLRRETIKTEVMRPVEVTVRR